MVKDAITHLRINAKVRGPELGIGQVSSATCMQDTFLIVDLVFVMYENKLLVRYSVR